MIGEAKPEIWTTWPIVAVVMISDRITGERVDEVVEVIGGDVDGVGVGVGVSSLKFAFSPETEVDVDVSTGGGPLALISIERAPPLIFVDDEACD